MQRVREATGIEASQVAAFGFSPDVAGSGIHPNLVEMRLMVMAGVNIDECAGLQNSSIRDILRNRAHRYIDWMFDRLDEEGKGG